MAQAILSLLAGLVSLANSFVRFLHEQQMIDAAKAQQQLKDMQAANDRAQMAIAARETQRNLNMQQPDKLREPDEFERPD